MAAPYPRNAFGSSVTSYTFHSPDQRAGSAVREATPSGRRLVVLDIAGSRSRDRWQAVILSSRVALCPEWNPASIAQCLAT